MTPPLNEPGTAALGQGEKGSDICASSTLLQVRDHSRSSVLVVSKLDTCLGCALAMAQTALAVLK